MKESCQLFTRNVSSGKFVSAVLYVIMFNNIIMFCLFQLMLI